MARGMAYTTAIWSVVWSVGKMENKRVGLWAYISVDMKAESKDTSMAETKVLNLEYQSGEKKAAK